MTCGVHRHCADEDPKRCPWCEINMLVAMLFEVHEVASALEAMGSEADWNLSMPQVVRDMCRHQAARLRKALPSEDT